MAQLDGQELLHLALDSAGRGDHGRAIEYLKQAIDLQDGQSVSSTQYAQYLYLLGAEYAQIGMMDRARDHISRAVSMDPSLHTARLQLALLLIGAADVPAAINELQPLAALGNSSAMGCFGKALHHLLHDEFVPCKELLLQGIKLNTESDQPNLPLNDDMRKLLNSIEEHGAGPSVVAAMASQADAEAGFLMSEYSKQAGR